MNSLCPKPKKVTLLDGMVHPFAKVEQTLCEGYEHLEAYELVLQRDVIQIFASTHCGLFRAESTLKQLRTFYRDGLPCMKIADEPDFEARGFSLDISRSKVPTMETLRDLIDLLAELKYNQLYLYNEHVFAYQAHKTVWEGTSPLTADDVQFLDEYCAKRFIDLVPVQNSLGHMENWLKHPEYKYLAECPAGFYYEPFKKHFDTGTTLAPTDQTLAFLAELYNEFLRNFQSGQFMVGCDEPWEFGMGRSKEQVEKEGFGGVYSQWILSLNTLAKKHQRRLMYYADVAIEHPEILKKLPSDTIPVVWEYYPDALSPSTCDLISKNFTDYYLMSGVNTWFSFLGRTDYARRNIQQLADVGKGCGASGLILSAWGDGGNHFSWATLFPGLLMSAAESWNVGSLEMEALPSWLDRLVFGEGSEGLGALLIELTDIDYIYELEGWPKGFPHHLSFHGFFSSGKKWKQFFDGSITEEIAQNTHSRFIETREKLEQINPTSTSGKLAKQEIVLSTDMAILGVERGLHYVRGLPLDVFKDRYEEMIEEYERVWLLRARSGGLEKSISIIRAVYDKTEDQSQFFISSSTGIPPASTVNLQNKE